MILLLKFLVVMLLVSFFAGCSTTSDGKRHLGWVISEKKGCVEKVTIRKKGLVWKKCF